MNPINPIDPNNSIKFYSHINGQYSCFSNFSPHPVKIDGKTYPTTEHYFQSQKFVDNIQYMEKIRLAATPAYAKKLGNAQVYGYRKNWDKVKEYIMIKCLIAKFTQNKELQKILLSTRNKILIEHTKNDLYWGDGMDSSGLNRLGHCLMLVRELIR